MLASLVMAVAIPDAFGSRARSSPARTSRSRSVGTSSSPSSWPDAARPSGSPRAILIWFAASGVFWLAGAFVAGAARIVLWLSRSRSTTSAPPSSTGCRAAAVRPVDSWDVETSHFAERFQLFIIIALGESIVITGATTAELTLDTARFAAFGLAFVSTAALWWLYFDYVAIIAQRRLALASRARGWPGTATPTYTSSSSPGIIVSAVGDEIVIAHPLDAPDAGARRSRRGPAIYLLGHVLFRLRMAGSLSWKRLLGAVACLVVGLAGTVASALVVASLLVAVLAC